MMYGFKRQVFAWMGAFLFIFCSKMSAANAHVLSAMSTNEVKSITSQHSKSPSKLKSKKHRRPKKAFSKTRKRTKQKRRRHHRARRGRLHLYQLQSAPGLEVRTPRLAWGALNTIELLNDLGDAYHYCHPQYPPLVIGHLSRRYGGYLYPHKSHRTGQDVDIFLLSKKKQKFWETVTARTLDLKRTWFVTLMLLLSDEVEYIFLDRRLIWALKRQAKREGTSKIDIAKYFGPIIRHSPGHKNHMHVRFKVRPTAQELISHLIKPTNGAAAKTIR